MSTKSKASQSTDSGAGDSADETEGALAAPTPASPTISGGDVADGIVKQHGANPNHAARPQPSDDSMDETPDMFFTASEVSVSFEHCNHPTYTPSLAIACFYQYPTRTRAKHAGKDIFYEIFLVLTNRGTC